MNTKQIIILVAVVALVVAGSFSLALVLDKSGTSTVSSTGEATVSTINVSGTCEVSVPADVGYIQMGVETQDKDVKEAQSENAKRMEEIIDAVKELGLTDEDITTSNYSIYPNYDYSEGIRSEEPTYYTVSNTVKLKVKDLDILGDVIDIATEAGANRAYSIYFDAEDTVAAQDDALAKAVEDALRKAEIIAGAANVKVVGVKTINDQTYYSTGYYDYAAERSVKADSALDYATPIMSGQVSVTANVYVEVIVSN
ncbi:MAG: SIMPL domain-containing protein [Eubacteriales bacterium]